ncbi:MAG: ATP-dependent Clp protease adaptor protein ClpS [Candidatus Xenobia bacterium]|jgi:ATP-dependent Clp protease adaptor protein ClpS
MAPTLPVIEEITESKAKPQRNWRVILYNDNVHKADDVVLWLQKATGCSLQCAEMVMLTAHTTGRAVCFEGEKEDCQKVARYLRGQGLQVEVDDF